MDLSYWFFQTLGVARWKIWFLCKSWYPAMHVNHAGSFDFGPSSSGHAEVQNVLRTSRNFLSTLALFLMIQTVSVSSSST